MFLFITFKRGLLCYSFFSNAVAGLLPSVGKMVLVMLLEDSRNWGTFTITLSIRGKNMPDVLVWKKCDSNTRPPEVCFTIIIANVQSMFYWRRIWISLWIECFFQLLHKVIFLYLETSCRTNKVLLVSIRMNCILTWIRES